MIWLLLFAHLCMAEATVYDVTTIYRLLEFPVRELQTPTTGYSISSPADCFGSHCDWIKEGWSETESGNFGVSFPNTVTHELASAANNFSQKMSLTSNIFDVVVQPGIQAVMFIFSTEELDAIADLIVLEIKNTETRTFHYKSRWYKEERTAYRCIKGQMGHIMQLQDGSVTNCDLISKVDVTREVSDFEDVEQFRIDIDVKQLRLQVVRNGFSNTTVFDLQHIIQLSDIKYLKVVGNGSIIFSTAVLSLTEKLGTLLTSTQYLDTAAICVIVTGYIDPRSGASMVVSAEYDSATSVKLGVITASNSNVTLDPDNKALIRGNAKSWKIVHFVDPSKNENFRIRLTVDKLHDFPVLIKDVTFCHEDVQVEIHARTNARGLPYTISDGTITEPNIGFNFPSCDIYSGTCSWTTQNLFPSAMSRPSYFDVDAMSIKSEFSRDSLIDRKTFSGTLFASVNTVKAGSRSTLIILLVEEQTDQLYYLKILTNDETNVNYVSIMDCSYSRWSGNVHFSDGTRYQCSDFFSGELKEYFSSKVDLEMSVHVTRGHLILKVNGALVVDQVLPDGLDIKYYRVGVKDLIGSIITSSMMTYTLRNDNIGTLVSPVVELPSSKLCVVVDYYVEDGDNSTIDVTLSSVDSDVTQEKFMQNVNQSTTTRKLPTDFKKQTWTQDMIMFQIPNDELHKSAHIKLTATRGSENAKVMVQRLTGCNTDEEEDVKIFPMTEKINNESPGFDVAVKDRTGYLSKPPCSNGGTKDRYDEECICPAGFYGSKCESDDEDSNDDDMEEKTNESPGDEEPVKDSTVQRSRTQCLNGGKKDRYEKDCICPAGFYGSECESGCGANSYGADCGGRCSATDRECRGMLLCRPLLGCACAPGFSGSTCDTPCLSGFYGSNCTQTCGQCNTDTSDEDQACDRYSGECRHGCKPGFYAPLCKENYTYLSSAPVAYYQNNDFGVSFNLENQKGRGTPMFFQIQTRRRTPDLSKAVATEPNISTWQSLTPELISEVSSEETTIIWRKLPGLKPGRLYQVRVIVVDRDGGRYEGEDVPVNDIRTNCSIPASAKLSTLVSNITEDSFAIKWNDVEVMDDWCPAEKYEVHVKIGWQWVVRQYEHHVLQDTFQHLLPGRSYQVRLRTITAFGATGFTDTLAATTLNARVLGRVGGLSVTSASQSQITVHWTPPSNSHESTCLQYRVMFECLYHLACNNIDCSNSSGQIETTSTFASLSHLLPFSRYNVTVFALSAATGVPSSIQAATDRAAPSVPPMLSTKPVVSRTNSSISFEWKAPESCSGINGYLRGYHCQLFVEGSAKPVAEINTETTVAVFDGLDPHTEYTVKIYATTSNGWNVNYPLTITGKTRATTPAMVKDLTVYKRGRRMLGLRWSKPNLTYGTLRFFTLTIRRGTGEEPMSVRVEAKPCTAWPELYCHTLNNLNQDQEYEISVQARNAEVEEDGDATSVKGTTKEGAPTAPSYLKLTKLTDKSVTIEWGIPSLINGQLRSFLINIEETDSVNASDCCQNFPMKEVLVKAEEKSYHFELPDLRPASTYMISVTGKTVALGPSVSRTVNTRPPTPTLLTAPRLATPTDPDTPTKPDKSIRVVMYPAEQYQDMISGYLLLLASNETRDVTPAITDTWLAQELSKINPTLFLVAEKTKGELDGGAIVELARDEVAKRGRFGVVSVDSLSTGTYELVQVVILDYCGSLSLAYVRGDNVIIN